MVLVNAAFGLLYVQSWAGTGAVGAQAFALAGVLLGIVAISAGRGPHSEVNDTYHRLMVVTLATGLVALFAPKVRGALQR